MASRVVPTPGVSPDGWVSLGVLARAHGIQGALKFHPWNDDSDVLRPGLEVQLGSPRGWRSIRVVSYAAPILFLEGVRDRTAAEALQGVELRVRRVDFPQDEEATWLVDLVGARVVREGGALLGHVAGFSDNGAQVLLEVKTPTGDVLVPFVEPIVQTVDAASADRTARIVLRPPQGLFDDDVILDEERPDVEQRRGGDADDEEPSSPGDGA